MTADAASNGLRVRETANGYPLGNCGSTKSLCVVAVLDNL